MALVQLPLGLSQVVQVATEMSDATHAVQVVSVDDVEYVSAVHWLQDDAPTLRAVFVMNPALQFAHFTSPFAVEYVPA